MRIPKGGIAFFDSGIGGMTVLDECTKHIKEEIFYYFGDNHHAPYGNLSPSKIRKYVLRAFCLFQKLKVKAVVIACNTATAICIDELREKYTFPIIGAEPAVLLAAKAEKAGGEIFVFTTRATYDSNRFRALCANAQAIYPMVNLHLYPCDHLAGEIETHIEDRDFNYSQWLPNGHPSGIVLGCTHYVYIKEYIKEIYNCPIFDGNVGIAKRLKEALFAVSQEKNVNNRGERPLEKKLQKNHPFLTTFRLITEEKRKANKRSDFCRLKNRGTPLVEKGTAIFFLGKNARKNARFYKQMFVLSNKKSKVVKNPKKIKKK